MKYKIIITLLSETKLERDERLKAILYQLMPHYIYVTTESEEVKE